MVDLILENGGILDKYIGDAMMAVFGPPFERPDDADRAVRAAVDMLRALHAFNAEREARGHEPVHMGVGLNTDEVVSGNIGSLRRMDYTVIGDGVNLASRLEGANKQYGTEVLLSASTVAKLQTPFLLREVDRIVVKGKTQPVAVYEVLDHHTDATFPHRDDVLAHYQRGLDLYRQRAWDDASAAFADALRLHPADSLPKLYQDRCAIYRETPPPADWQGVFTLTSK